jgi:hypothetical protein
MPICEAMAISRPLLLVLIAVALLGATAFAIQGSRATDDGGGTAAAPAAQSQPGATQATPAARANPSQTVQSAFSLDSVKSGHFDGTLAVRQPGESTGRIELSGDFQLGGPADLPKLDVRVRVDGPGSKLDVGFVSTGDRAYLVQNGTGYQLPADLWAQAQQSRTQRGASSAPSLASLGIEPQRWIRNAKSQGSERIDGVETEHVSASLDAGAALSDLAQLAKRTGQAGALPVQADAVKRAELDVWVGSDDKVLRRASAELEVAGGTVKLDFRLSEVNDPQSIDAPKRVSDALPAGLLGGAAPSFSSGLSLATGADASTLRLPRNNNPRKLARALEDNRKVLLFFHQERGLDDKATAEAVREADRRTRALVLKDDVRNSKRYGDLVENLGVTQAPSIVIVDRRGDAHLIEGYVDGGTLVQELTDAR